MYRRIAGAVVLLLIVLPIAPATGTSGQQPHSLYRILPAFDVPTTPDHLDRIAFVQHWFGTRPPSLPPSAVLILVPGFFGGAEDFRYVGQRLVARLPRLQVWAVDRRNNFLENRCGLELAQATASVEIAMAYYLQNVDFARCPPHADLDDAVWNGASREFAVSQQEAAALGMGSWGLATELEDVRRLVTFARRQYPKAKVFLGGHSLGGMTAQIYAGWRFGSGEETAGWHTIDGLVLIDGGVDGMNWAAGLVPQYVSERTLVNSGILYWDIFPRTPVLGPLAEIAALAASLHPTLESFLWQNLPPPLVWPVDSTCPTNKALFAVFTDDNGFNPDFRMHQGTIQFPPIDLNHDGLPDRCADPNAGRFLLHWVDFNFTFPPELTSTDRWARTVWESTDTNVVEWYFSILLNADIDLASNLNSRATFIHPATGALTSAEASEGHRVLDTARVAVPVYAFAAAECRERFDWYRTVATAVPDLTIVDHSAEGCPEPSTVPYAHLDPLFAEDTGTFVNAFIDTLAAWLDQRL